MNKFAVFAVSNVATIFLLIWVGLIPEWVILFPIVQSIPLFAWADDYENSRR
jgi:hypothetical protein